MYCRNKGVINIIVLTTSLLLTTAALSCSGNGGAQCQQDADDGYADKAAAVTALMKEGRLDESLSQADALCKNHPSEPQTYFIRGSILHLMGDSVGATADFMKAQAAYDSLIAVKDNFADRINHACITQLLYGQEAYDKEIEELLGNPILSDEESLSVENTFKSMHVDIKELWQ